MVAAFSLVAREMPAMRKLLLVGTKEKEKEKAR